MGTDVQLAAIVLAFIHKHQNETVYADQVKKLSTSITEEHPGAPVVVVVWRPSVVTIQSVVPGRLRLPQT